MGIIEDRSPLKILKEGPGLVFECPSARKPFMSFSICVWAVLLPPLTKLRGGVIFSRLTVYPTYLQNGFFLPERRFVKFRAHGTLVCSRNKNAGWPWNLATKCGGVVHTERNSRHLEPMRIVRHADRPYRRERTFRRLGLPTPTPRDPSSLPEMNSRVDAEIVMRGSRRRQAAGGPPGVFLLQFAHHAAR